MKALSVRQPWAFHILNSGKDIENRSWRTRHRGWIAIHASTKVEQDEDVDLPRGVRRPKPDQLVTGAIVGVVRVVDVVERKRSKWHLSGQLGWVLASPRRLKKPIRCKGKLSLWQVPPGAMAQITKQIGRLKD